MIFYIYIYIYICVYICRRLHTIIIQSASRSPPGHNKFHGFIYCLSAFCPESRFLTHFDNCGTLLGSLLQPWVHFWSTLDAVSLSQNRLGRQRCPKRRHPRNFPKFPHPFGHLSEVIFIHFHSS